MPPNVAEPEPSRSAVAPAPPTEPLNVPRCIIHPQQINADGNMLAQIHFQRPNGEPQTQSYYVSQTDLSDFIQHNQQKYPHMQFVKQQQQPQQLSSGTASTAYTPYDKFSSTYSSCDVAFGQGQLPAGAIGSHSGNADPNC